MNELKFTYKVNLLLTNGVHNVIIRLTSKVN